MAQHERVAKISIEWGIFDDITKPEQFKGYSGRFVNISYEELRKFEEAAEAIEMLERTVAAAKRLAALK